MTSIVDIILVINKTCFHTSTATEIRMIDIDSRVKYVHMDASTTNGVSYFTKEYVAPDQLPSRLIHRIGCHVVFISAIDASKSPARHVHLSDDIALAF